MNNIYKHNLSTFENRYFFPLINDSSNNGSMPEPDPELTNKKTIWTDIIKYKINNLFGILFFGIKVDFLILGMLSAYSPTYSPRMFNRLSLLPIVKGLRGK
jgi:hypothetical protein